MPGQSLSRWLVGAGLSLSVVVLAPRTALADGDLATLAAALAEPPVYAGPRLEAPPAPSTQAPAAAMDVIKLWYAMEISERSQALETELRRIDAGPVNAELARQRQLATGCARDLAAEPSRLVAEFLRATSADAETQALAALSRASARLSPSEQACVAALARKLGPGGVLLAGVTRQKSSGARLMPSIAMVGVAYILHPQPITAWPGQRETALAVLDPRQGPFKVKAAVTPYEKLEGHPEPWKRQPHINVREYLELGNKTDSQLLVVDAKDQPLGWLDMDSAALFGVASTWDAQPDSVSRGNQKMRLRDGADSKQFYVTGLAAYLNGVWWSDVGTQWTAESKPDQGEFEAWDFLRLVTLTTSIAKRKTGDPYDPTLTFMVLRRARFGDSGWTTSSEFNKWTITPSFGLDANADRWSSDLSRRYQVNVRPPDARNEGLSIECEGVISTLKGGRFVQERRPVLSRRRATLQEIYGLK